MIIIETCPECGHDLQDLVLTTYPPIPQKKCINCGWSWTGRQETKEVVRIPFGSNVLINGETMYVFDNHENEMTICNL